MNENNIRVFAVKNEKKSGINIYLDFSGQREYLMTRRPNLILYEMLKNGKSLAALRRTKTYQMSTRDGIRFWGNASVKAERALRFLLQCIDEYIEERNEYEDELSA